VRRLTRGFTLVELLIAVALLGLIAAVVYPLITGNRRLYQSTAQRIDAQQALRAATTILTTELRELDAAEGDILALSETGLTIRATRQLAFLCADPSPGATSVLAIRESPLFAVRDFNPATDSLFIHFVDSTDHDSWLLARLVSVGTGVCADGTAARTLSVRYATPAAELAVGAPVRGFEVVSYRLYRAGDGQWQIGLEDGGAGSIQPLVGPVTSNGLAFIPRDAAGGLTTDPTRVATIEIDVRVAGDSQTTAVALRNNRSH
jgi:prepilin-type N-terminal cleavage/methylation domain-containing protein